MTQSTAATATAASAAAAPRQSTHHLQLFKRVQLLLLVWVLSPPAPHQTGLVLVHADTKGAAKAFVKQSSGSKQQSQQQQSQKQQQKQQQQQQHWSELYDDIGANLDAHPDPNQEHHEGMIYVGRWAHTADHHETVVDTATDPNSHRLGFDVDNAIKYIFGTSLVEDIHGGIEEHELHPDHPDDHIWHHDVADRGHATKTREEALKERRHKGISDQGPKPFGHFDTHALDGGANPPTVVKVEPFFLDATLVTNEQFVKFVRATYYETEAEQFGWSYVLQSFLGKRYEPSDTTTNIHVDPDAPEWVAVEGAYWRRPEGPSSSYKFREQHPVVHVSHRDAAEYCRWKGKRLAGEREWEASARAGHWGPTNRSCYTWGNDADWDTARQHANLWGAGVFPQTNLAEDGWRGTSPVKTYPPNPMGFYDMTGNVWEWMRGGKSVRNVLYCLVDCSMCRIVF